MTRQRILAHRRPIARHLMALCLLALYLWQGAAQAATYDPLAYLYPIETLKTLDTTLQDPPRDRIIPVLVTYPNARGPFPVILFSHGLGGSRNAAPYLAKHWAARGYITVFLQHPGSDEKIWGNNGFSFGNRTAMMQTAGRAATGENLNLRIGDVSTALDRLKLWNYDPSHPLYHRMDLSRVGMSGHSFGAVTTQSVSGEKRIGSSKTEPRIDAALALSPSPPAYGDPARAYEDVRIPWMLMTGTEDFGQVGRAQSPGDRLLVYPALPTGGKYELVLFGAKHSAFGERPGSPMERLKNPNHHRVIKALSTAFWDTYLKENASAGLWLDGNGAAALLEPKDRFRHK